jgi:hypothetical protein
MSRSSVGKFMMFVLMTILLVATATTTWGQATQGRVDVTVLDQKNAYVTGAKIVLRDTVTNTERNADAQNGGTYSFVNLPLGKYKLTISKDGFETESYDVEVEVSKTTSVSATLKVGAVTQVVEVGAAAPVMDTTSNNIGAVINTKSVEDLPLSGRNLTALSTLTPGYTGTWNGLPSIAQGNNVDGVMGSPSRMKFGGNSSPSVQVRLENIEEMTIQTDQLDLNQGFGQSSMQINFTTRRGGNDFHGRAFEDFRNSYLNANSWRNNANTPTTPRPHLELNEFGGSVGGHVIKNKLFFFGSFSTDQQPGTASAGASVLTAPAQASNFTYTATSAPTPAQLAAAPWVTCAGTLCTANLFGLAQNWNTNNPTQTIAASLNSVIGTNLSAINTSVAGSSLTAGSDPNILGLTFNTPAPIKAYYPTFRIDWDVTKKIRTSLAYNETITIQPVANAPYFPGAGFASSAAGNRFKAYPAALGIEWTISPTLVNQFNGGFLYNSNYFGYNSPGLYKTSPQIVGWPLVTSPQQYYLPVTSYYPVFNASDTLNWQHRSHALSFGFSFYREQDHYWNPPEGITSISLGLASGDPALTPFSTNAATTLPGSNTSEQGEAQSLYSLLTGRISSTFVRNTYQPATNSYSSAVTAFNLDELSKAAGVFAQDSWRVRPNLTFNYGLRWDFTGAQHDLNGVYHNSDLTSIMGPTPLGNLFHPGVLTGNMNPTINARPNPYNGWYKSPQPMFGIAWSPQPTNDILRKAVGSSGTVIRAGFSLRDFTVPYQYFWDDASNFGTFFYQFGTLTPTNSPGVGNYAPGSLALGQALPPQAVSPATFQNVAPESQFTFVGGNGAVGVNGIKQNIRQPYTMAWNFGIQRKLGQSRVLEVRYDGNRTIHQWISENLNEVNVFENGFLTEFEHAQGNMAICKANSAACLAAQAAAGIGSGQQTANNFADWGLPGQVALPILTTAFTGTSLLSPATQANSNFRGAGTSFITNLNTGGVGSMASSLTRLSGTPYFCNLVGPTFTPCVANAGYAGGTNGPGGGYPINFFQANPFATGSSTGYMTDAGYSNYNSLQVDFRQRQWHGVEFDANYTWSHSLGVSTPNDWTGAYPAFSLRNLRYGYGPSLFDLRHVAHVTLTADLPFGRGKTFLNRGGIVDRVLGGWTAATIFRYQSGYPVALGGSYSTFNNIAPGGVNLVGITRQQLQSEVGVYRVPGKNFVNLLPASAYAVTTPFPNGGANPALIVPNTTPGVFGTPIYLTGNHGLYDDIAVSKSIPITERVHFSIQLEMLNAFNHPVFGNGTNPISGSVLGTGWAEATSSGSFGRQLELRGNITF